MGSQENAELLRRGYAAFSAADMATLTELIADDVVWHAPGLGPLAGDYKGRDAVLAFFGELASRTGGTLKQTVHDVIGGEEHTIGLVHVHAERNGKVLDQNGVHVAHLRDGRVSEFWQFNEDDAAGAAFWS